MPRLSQHLPEDAAAFELALNKALAGLEVAEELLLNSSWSPTRYAMEPNWKAVAKTIDLRARWQRIRIEASKGFEAWIHPCRDVRDDSYDHILKGFYLR